MTVTSPALAGDLSVNEFCLGSAGSQDRRPLYFTTDEEELFRNQRSPLGLAGAVSVRVGVDMEHDQVVIDSHRSSQPALLEAAIADLQRIRETLPAVSPSAAIGRCMLGAEWGRCQLEDGHEGSHEGQTEEQWEAGKEVLHDRRLPKAG